MAVTPQISYRRMLATIEEDRGLGNILTSNVGQFLDSAAEIQGVVDLLRDLYRLQAEALRDREGHDFDMGYRGR